MISVETTKSVPDAANPIGLRGIAFVEFTGPDPGYIDRIFKAFGLSKLKKHRSKPVTYYRQNDIHFLLNEEPAGFAADFRSKHGPSICSMGWRVDNPEQAFEEAVKRGAKPFNASDYGDKALQSPAIYGIGDSIIYFIRHDGDAQPRYANDDYLKEFEDLPNPEPVEQKGFYVVDHLTNNVEKGTMAAWSDFYKNIFGFTEIRYFDIKGQHTGLTSFALKSPCQTFSIPINEGTEEKSQINEYLIEYKGAGIQHLALLSGDLLDTLDKLQGSGIETLDIHEGYYEEAFQRVPQVTEDKNRIMKHNVLVDGDEKGYLLQIFTKNLFGPIFFEMIQRKGHGGFGEGNFTALFRSIERDQQRRGFI